MKLTKAVDITIQLAKQGMLGYKEAEVMDMIDQHEAQDEAIGIVEDLLTSESLEKKLYNIRINCPSLRSKTDAEIVDFALTWIKANSDAVEAWEAK